VALDGVRAWLHIAQRGQLRWQSKERQQGHYQE
jgi:hypothetical protein